MGRFRAKAGAWVLAACLAGLVSTGGALAGQSHPDPAALQKNLDIVWVLIAAGLVLLMQVGFMLVEAGMVRSKNAVSVAQKNLLDFTFSVIVFAAVGFMLAFGTSSILPVGFDTGLLMLSGLDDWGLVFFIFQVMFCGTAATIMSGAVAERMPLSAYVLSSIFIAGLVYPVFVHWAWGSALAENSGAFLANMGFVDFAGSTVVHGTGAWIALAACLVIGARSGRFDSAGNPVRFHGHSPVLATVGALLLFVGWIGFNGGSTLSATPDVAQIIANTVLAAATGAAAGYLVAAWQSGAFYPDKIFSGMLGGLVAVTAGCLVLDTSGALIIGFLGGTAAILGIQWLETRFKVDDAVGAIGVHGIAGVVGTLGLALLAPVDQLPLGNRMDQLSVQLLGAGLNFVWAFGLGLLFFAGLRRVMTIRVDAQNELVGLNETEHGARMGTGHVEDALDRLTSGTADLSLRLPVAPGDETERLTTLFNTLIDEMESVESRRDAVRDLRRDSEESERLKALANATSEAIVISVDGEIIDGNTALEELIGLPLEKIKSRKMREFVVSSDLPMLSEQLKKPKAGPYELTITDARGAEIPIEVRAREIVYRGKRTRLSAVVDLRDRKAAEERIRHLAQHDPLTDLPNRALFTDKLEEVLKASTDGGIGVAVLLIDLDRFKDINDLHGHPAGDMVIKETAKRLRNGVRPADTVARLGGDEFAVIQTGIAFASQAGDLAGRLVDLLADPFDCGDGLVLRTGASIGVSVSPDHGTESETLISRADTALYQAKSRGRNTHCVFEPGMDAQARNRQLLEAEMAPALENDEFELYLQPRLNVGLKTISSYEALIRWNHPQKGMISPADFIPVAEQSAHIVSIGEWVLRRACAIAAGNLGKARISVNVSPLQFRESDFPGTVKAAIAEHGIDPERLEIEITEGLLIDDVDRAQAILTTLKDMGVRIALDDFGTGYSSLGYLSRFPFDTIKIDRTFVRNMDENDNAHAIVETIVRLGRALGMSIVAEGVETTKQLSVLVGHGCDEVQGYLVGRPLPLTELCQEPPADVLAILNPTRAAPSALAKTLRSKAQSMRDRGIDDGTGVSGRQPAPASRRAT